jgi:cathepsin L
VLLVGSGKDEKKGVENNFYKIKNSWGESWGEGGYIRIGRGEEYNEGDGQCGVLKEGKKVILNKKIERMLLR